MDLERKYPHKKATYVPGKRPYITFGVWNEKKQKIERIRWYKGFSQLKTERERLAYAEDNIRTINTDLPYWVREKIQVKSTVKEEKERGFESIEEAIAFILKLRYPKDGNRKTSFSMSSTTKQFLVYLNEADLLHLRPDQLDRNHVQDYIDYMVLREKLAPKTISNRIGGIRAIFSQLQHRNFIPSNPFKGNFDKPKVVKTNSNMAFDPDQVKKIKEYFTSENPSLWLVCQVIYYTYLRPVEIGRLRVKHLLFDKDLIHVPAEISKNRKDAFIVIPEPLKKELIKLKLEKLPKDYFVFGRSWTPGKEEIGRETFTKAHRKLLNLLGFPSQFTLYSWKHTGVVNAYKAGIDIKSIQLQCRHSSIEQTDTYLKSLGFLENDSFKGIPEI